MVTQCGSGGCWSGWEDKIIHLSYGVETQKKTTNWSATATTAWNCTGCPTHYRTRHFFNNFTTNEDNATKFEADLPHYVRNVKEKNVLLFKFRCNIFIGVRIIKEMPGSVASGTPCIWFMWVKGTDKLRKVLSAVTYCTR